MSVVEAAVDIDAAPEEVWGIVADPRNLPQWDRHVVDVEGIPRGGLRKGSTYTTVIRFMGVRARVGARVLELRKPEYAKVRLKGLLDATIETWLEPANGGRSRLRHRVDYRFRGGPLGSLGAAATSRLGAAVMLRRGTEAQKRHVEGG